MKDPTASTAGAQDPNLVSAYAVYKGLAPGLKSFEDTSGGTSATRRKKAKKRKQKSEGGATKNESVLETGSTEVAKNNLNASPTKSPKAKDKQEQSKTVNGTGDTVNNIENGEVSQEKKRKKKKRKKGKKNNAQSSELDTTVTLETSGADYSDDDNEAPPLKSMKLSKNADLVPNPLAKKSVVTTGKAKDLNKSSSSTSSVSPVKPVRNKRNTSQRFDSDDEEPSTSASALKSRQKAIQGPPSSKSSGFVREVISKAPPPEIRSVFTSQRVEDSVSHGKDILEWLLHPVTSSDFMKNHFERQPLLVKRKHSESADFYKWILTTQLFDDILRRNVVKYGVNLDITSYTDGVRETLSESMQGKARPAVVWDYYNNGCSLRMLNPQTYIRPLWRISAALQEWFGSFVGANMYLTPPDSQGFAPHFDDIEAFILQIEGKKRWKLYGPRSEEEKMPRFSSGNFSEDDGLGKPILDVVLEEGDVLYFPRGIIHQAKTVDGEHSLHITLSCHQLNTYGDLLKHHVNQALEKLMAKDVTFREGLPNDYLSFMGIAHENTKDSRLRQKRQAFSKKIEGLVTKLAKEPADYAADAIGKKFIWDSLPPYLTSKERETCVVEDGEFIQNGKVFNRVEFGPEVEVKLVRKNCVRLVVEDGNVKLYYSSENPMVYHEEEAQFLELSVESSPVVNHLISKYPAYTKIEDLPIRSGDIGDKIQIISDLWERGLIFTKEPLEPAEFDDDDDSNASTSADEQDPRPGKNGKKNGENDSDVESVNLSDLPEDGQDTDEMSDDFYDTTASYEGWDEEDDESDEDDSVGEEYEVVSDDEADDGQADIGDFFDMEAEEGEEPIDHGEDDDDEDLDEEEDDSSVDKYFEDDFTEDEEELVHFN